MSIIEFKGDASDGLCLDDTNTLNSEEKLLFDYFRQQSAIRKDWVNLCVNDLREKVRNGFVLFAAYPFICLPHKPNPTLESKMHELWEEANRLMVGCDINTPNGWSKWCETSYYKALELLSQQVYASYGKVEDYPSDKRLVSYHVIDDSQIDDHNFYLIVGIRNFGMACPGDFGGSGLHLQHVQRPNF